MKKEVKNKPRIKKWVIFLIIGIALLVIGLVVYFLYINSGKSFLGFTLPDFSSTAVGETIGDILNANVWKNIKLNPFGE